MEEKHHISNIQYLPGIRFHPSDEELITYYLQRKVNSLSLPANVITDIELYRFNPWDLPGKALFGGDEWFFFTPRDRKYPNGRRPNRTAGSGYWKATGPDKQILSSFGSRIIGVKKVLVFYKGRPPKGTKMNWIMTEYRLDPDRSRPFRSMRLDDWVLCRIKQKGNKSKKAEEDDHSSSKLLNYMPMIKELPSVCIEDSRDMFADYLQSSEQQLIDSLLIGHDPEVLTIPKTTFQGHKSSNSSRILRGDKSGKMNFQAKFSVSEVCFNSAQGRPKEKNMYPNIQLPINMIMNEEKDGVSQSGQMVAIMGTNTHCQEVSEVNKFKTNYSSNDYINLWELDMPPLSEDFM